MDHQEQKETSKVVAWAKSRRQPWPIPNMSQTDQDHLLKYVLRIFMLLLQLDLPFLSSQ
jgi:hypothetical protein